jgi:hypothetical protein
MFYMTGLPLEPFTMIRMAELIGRTLLHVFNFLVCATMDRCAKDAVVYGTICTHACYHSSNSHAKILWRLQIICAVLFFMEIYLCIALMSSCGYFRWMFASWKMPGDQWQTSRWEFLHWRLVYISVNLHCCVSLVTFTISTCCLGYLKTSQILSKPFNLVYLCIKLLDMSLIIHLQSLFSHRIFCIVDYIFVKLYEPYNLYLFANISCLTFLHQLLLTDRVVTFFCSFIPGPAFICTDCWNCLWLGFNYVFLVNIWSRSFKKKIDLVIWTATFQF